MFSRKKAPGPSPNRRPLVLVVALTAAFTALTAIALAPSTPLEVDGNAIDNAGGGEDWDVNLPVLKRDHVTGESGAEDAYVQGGSKDERDISSAGVTSQYWRYGNAQVPDKDDLVHAFAKEYVVNGDKLLYFGATRASNDGDSSIGFWFLKKAISLGTAPNFIGTHSVGDILVTGDFGKGGGATTINVFRWNGSGLDTLVTSAGSNVPVFCDVNVAGSANKACVSANQSAQTIPANMANYVFKMGGNNVFPADGKFPVGTFIEGGIDLGALGLPTDTCFSTVLAMTRSSSSTSAQLKDFVIQPFGGCDIEANKVCKTTVIGTGGSFLTSTFDVSVTAKGGTITNAGFEEDITLSANGSGFPRCRRTDTNALLTTDGFVQLAATLAKDATATLEVACDHTSETLLNNVTARASNGIDPLVDSFVMENTCAPLITTAITVTKACHTVELVVSGGTVQPKVCNKITVKNDSNELLNSIKVYDDPDGTAPMAQVTKDDLDPNFVLPTSLAPAASFTVTHCYIPTTTSGGQTDVEAAAFLNVASAEAVGALSGDTVSDTGEAQCPLCPAP
jgi:hypothetical protein